MPALLSELARRYPKRALLFGAAGKRVTSIPIQSEGKRLLNSGTRVASGFPVVGGLSPVMRSSPLVLSPVLALSLLAGIAHAGDLRITLPKRTKPTPVQKLNQDGVKAIQHHKIDQARKLFYKAYLLDPDDPFTLNNLGYISELNGDIERAQRYYELAAENTSDATVDRSTMESFKGKPVAEVAGRAADTQMQINRYN